MTNTVVQHQLLLATSFNELLKYYSGCVKPAKGNRINSMLTRSHDTMIPTVITTINRNEHNDRQGLNKVQTRAIKFEEVGTKHI